MNAVNGVVLDEQRVLLIKKAKEDGSFVWAFPGGNVQDNESLEEACIREVYDETGLVVKIVEELSERIHPDTNIPTKFYWCELDRNREQRMQIQDGTQIEDIMFCNRTQYEDFVTTDVYAPVRKLIDKHVK